MTPFRPNQYEGLDGGRHSGTFDDDETNEEALAEHDSYLSEFDSLFDDPNELDD